MQSHFSVLCTRLQFPSRVCQDTIEGIARVDCELIVTNILECELPISRKISRIIDIRGIVKLLGKSKLELIIISYNIL